MFSDSTFQQVYVASMLSCRVHLEVWFVRGGLASDVLMHSTVQTMLICSRAITREQMKVPGRTTALP